MAEIIAFPVRPAAAPDPAGRLRTALAALDAALQEQAETLAEWRGSLGALRNSVNGLGGSLTAYQGTLDRLQDKLAAVGETGR